MRMTKLRAKVRNGSIEREQRRNFAQGLALQTQTRVRSHWCALAQVPALEARVSSSRGCNV